MKNGKKNRSLAFAAVLLALGCGSRTQRPAAGQTERAPEAPSASIEVAEGRLLVGSIPGTAGRSSALEVDRVPTTIPEFAIDRAPFAANGTPRAGITRAEAAAACESRGARLCHELEWERACAGDASSTFPTGATYDAARCATDACPSPLGVERMGTARAEWTMSDGAPGPDGQPLAVVRGSAGTDANAHRCAARQLVPASSVDPNIGFRCCEGDAPSIAYPTESAPRATERIEPPIEEIRAALAGVPQLARFAADFRLFRREEQQDVVARGANARTPVVVQENRIVRNVLRWTPGPDTVWVFSGRSGTTSIIAVLYPLADGTFAHAASMVMPNDSTYAIVTIRDSEPRTLGFSTCLSCGGEDGEIRFRDDGRFDVVTR